MSDWLSVRFDFALSLLPQVVVSSVTFYPLVLYSQQEPVVADLLKYRKVRELNKLEGVVYSPRLCLQSLRRDLLMVAL